MLVQLFKDNYSDPPEESLECKMYDGYFGGTTANPNLTWFNTAILLSINNTSNLSSLSSATNQNFQVNLNDTEAMNDNWNMTNYTYTQLGLTITTRTQNNLRLTMTNSTDPALVLEGTARPTIDTSTFKYIHLRYKVVSGTPDVLQLFYYNATQGNTETRSVSRYYGSVTLGQWVNIVFDMSNDTNWTSGNWNRYRLDPISGGTAVIDFEYFVISNSIQPPDFNFKSLKISGYFRAKKTGVCRFFTRSDDASFLYIDDVLVVDNGGTHAPQNRFGNINTVAGTYYKIDVYYGESSVGEEFSAGYLEDNSTSTNINQFTTNATGLTTYYDINPHTQPVITSPNFPLVCLDHSLQGLFRVSILALYINRGQFATNKHRVFYMVSNELFNNFNGTYKNYIQLHEKPVANDIERKRFTQFSSDMSFECELDGKIEVVFRRGDEEPAQWRHAMLVLDVERIQTKRV